jgi:hypothetical protein
MHEKQAAPHVPRPHPTRIRAGDMEVVSMNEPTGSARWLPWVGAVLLVLAMNGPRGAVAKTYLPDTGPTLDGDPTADDQPSPAPKRSAPMRLEVRVPAQGSNWSTMRLIWLSYVRAWIRITIR